MRALHRLSITALLAAVLALTACEPEQEPMPEDRQVTATPAYRTYFGDPPTVKEGTCFAMVGFLPVNAEPEALRPVPLFVFEEAAQLRAVVGRVVSFDPEIAARMDLEAPFPSGTRLASLERTEDLVTVDLELPADAPVIGPRMLAALTHSVAQFPGVDRLRLLSGGEPVAGLPAEGARPDPGWLRKPASPRLLALRRDARVAGGKLQLAVLFDRPVNVERVVLRDDGRELAGDWYRAVFDMAAVLEKDGPAPAVGAELEVDWKVVDRLGREGQGQEILALEPAEHP